MLNPSPGSVKVIEELVRGRDFANQLLRHVINVGDGSSSSEATTPLTDEQLVDKVLMSFTNSILLLNNSTSEASDVQPRDTPTYWINDPSKSEGCHQGNCNTTTTTTIKRRRGCYERRISSKARVVESETPIEDGHRWKKYGHKMILSAKYMRTYYRCSHKYDQGCQATKQVQRVQDNPPIHKTIYYANHTCRNLLNPDNILHSNSASDSSVLLSFENTLPAKQDRPFLSSSSYPSSFPELTFDHSYSRDVTLSSTHNSDKWDVMSGLFYYSAELDQAFDPFLEF